RNAQEPFHDRPPPCEGPSLAPPPPTFKTRAIAPSSRDSRGGRVEHRAFSKAAWRLIPFMMLLYVCNFLDRVNVGFAALTMNKDLAIGAEAFGLVGGMFFIGYFFFEV